MSRNLICLVSFVLVLGLVGVADGVEGLLGEYFTWSGSPPSEPWGTPVMKRLDPTVDFNWAANAPDPSIGADNFAV